MENINQITFIKKRLGNAGGIIFIIAGLFLLFAGDRLLRLMPSILFIVMGSILTFAKDIVIVNFSENYYIDQFYLLGLKHNTKLDLPKIENIIVREFMASPKNSGYKGQTTTNFLFNTHYYYEIAIEYLNKSNKPRWIILCQSNNKVLINNYLYEISKKTNHTIIDKTYKKEFSSENTK